MEELLRALDTLAHESGGGGVIPSETLAGQRIRAAALFLDDGRVALVNLEESPRRCGGPPPFDKGGKGGEAP